MPRKKPSPSNRSTVDEGYSERIESDSSLELNSRRNTYRKKPQRKCSLKDDSNKTTKKGQIEVLQRNSSEQNKRRPSIIKIFRRIDRKAKNIYLVDDKVEDRSELVAPSDSKSDVNVSNKKNGPRLSKACSLEPTSDKKCLFNSSTPQTSLKTFQDHRKRTVKTTCRKHDNMDVGNPHDDHDVSDPSSIDKLAKKTEIVVSNQPYVTDIAETPRRGDAWNQPRNTGNLYSPVTDIAETSDSDDAWNQPCNTGNFYPPVKVFAETSDSDDAWNQPRNIGNLYSPVTDIFETSGSDDAWNQPRNIGNLYSPVTDFAKLDNDDAWNQPRNNGNLYSPVTDFAKLDNDDAWNQPRNNGNLYSPVTDFAKSDSDDAWNLPRNTDNLYSPVTDIFETSGSDDAWNQPRNTGNLYSPLTDISETSGSDDVWNQPRNTGNLCSPVTDFGYHYHNTFGRIITTSGCDNAS